MPPRRSRWRQPERAVIACRSGARYEPAAGGRIRPCGGQDVRRLPIEAGAESASPDCRPSKGDVATGGKQ